MARDIKKVKTGFKLRTTPKEGALSLKLGTKKFALPYEVRLIQSDEYVFVHVPPAAEIFRIEGKELVVVESNEEAAKATQSFRKSRKRTRSKNASAVEVPEELEMALNKIPKGYKLGYDADGNVRLVKTRVRTKKS